MGMLASQPTATVVITPIVGYQKKLTAPSHVKVGPHALSLPSVPAPATGVHNAVAVEIKAMSEHEHKVPTVAPQACSRQEAAGRVSHESVSYVDCDSERE